MKKLILVDPTAEHVDEILGISEDRRIELDEDTKAAVKKYFLEKDYGFANGAFDISQFCNDEQEYTLSLIAFVRAIGVFEKRMEENPLIGLMRLMGK